MTKQGVLRLYKCGSNYTDDEKHDLAGFYDVEMVDIEVMCNDVACTPADDASGHPDAWPRLLRYLNSHDRFHHELAEAGCKTTAPTSPTSTTPTPQG